MVEAASAQRTETSSREVVVEVQTAGAQSAERDAKMIAALARLDEKMQSIVSRDGKEAVCA